MISSGSKEKYSEIPILLFLASRKGSNFQEVNKSQAEIIGFWVEGSQHAKKLVSGI